MKKTINNTYLCVVELLHVLCLQPLLVGGYGLGQSAAAAVL